MCSASAQDAQNAAGAHHTAERNPNPPILIGRVANCCVSLKCCVSLSLCGRQQDLGCVPNVHIMRRTVRSEQLGGNVVRPRVGALKQYLPCALQVGHRRDRFPESSSDLMGVPSTVISLGCHTSKNKSSTFCGRIPALFHTRVLPWRHLIFTTLCRVVANKSHTTFTRDGPHKRCKSSKNAQLQLPPMRPGCKWQTKAE